MQKSASLSLLVLANLLATAILLVAAMLTAIFNPRYNLAFFALLAMISTQLWLLAIFTAFHDPRRRLTRWLSIAAVLFGSGVFLTFVAASAVYFMRFTMYGGFLMTAYVIFAGTSAILAGCMALILVCHIAAWPLRAALGWRLVKKDDPEASANARQFGITHLLAWVGLFASLLWLLKTLTAAGEAVAPLLAGLAVIAACVLFVLPWSYLLVKSKIKVWPIVAGIAVVAALCYLAQAAISQFNMYQITNSGAVAATFLLPSFQVQDFGAFCGTITLAAVLNFLMLRRMGYRFQAAKESLPTAANANAPQRNLAAPSMVEVRI